MDKQNGKWQMPHGGIPIDKLRALDKLYRDAPFFRGEEWVAYIEMSLRAGPYFGECEHFCICYKQIGIS